MPYGTKISAHTETSISVVNGHFDTAENLTFCTAFTTPNLKTAPNKIFRPLSKNLQRKCVLFLKLPDKQNLCNAKRRKLHGFASFCAIRYKKFRTQSNLTSCKQFFNLLRLHAMRKMLRQLRFDDCPSSKLHVCKKTPARLAKHLQTFFLLTFQKQKPRKTRGCFVEIYSASSSLLRSKADCRS